MIGWCSGRLDPKGKVRDVQAFLQVEVGDKAEARDLVLDNPTVIDDFLAENPHVLAADELARIGAWKKFVRGELVVERDLKRHTVFLDCKEPIAYAVLSLTDEVVDILPMQPPMLVEAVLLPWKGAIVCDGMVRFRPVHLGAGIRESLKATYSAAKAKGIVTSLEPRHEPSSRGSKKTRRSSSTSRTKAPDPGKAFGGKWRIVEMDVFDGDGFEMEGPAHVEFDEKGRGRFNFGLVSGEMDCRFSTEGDALLADFSWDGHDEHHPAMGRGRAVIDGGKMRGRTFVHNADETGFVAEKVPKRKRK